MMVKREEKNLRRERAKELLDTCDSFVLFGISKKKGALIFNHLDSIGDDAYLNSNIKNYVRYTDKVDMESLQEYLEKVRSGDNDEEFQKNMMVG